MLPRPNNTFLTTLKSTTTDKENIQRMVINPRLNMNWNGGITEKRLDSDSTFLWQDQGGKSQA